jgi:hypothetical protein
MPTFAASRSQNWCLKNTTSTPTTTAPSASAYSAPTARLPITAFYAVRPSESRSSLRLLRRYRRGCVGRRCARYDFPRSMFGREYRIPDIRDRE